MKGWTVRKLVMKFHEDKNQILYLKTGEVLLTLEDFNSIKNISVLICYRFLEELIEVFENNTMDDSLLCVFCTKHIYDKKKCGRCPYKKRHNWCNSKESQYLLILNKLDEVNFCDLPEIIELYKEVINNFKEHLRTL